MTAVPPPAPPRWWHDPLEVGRELALAGLSVAAVVSLGRLFAGSEHLGPLLANVAVAHLVLLTVRRLGRSLAVAAAVAPLAAIVLNGLLFAGDTTTIGVPSAATFDAIGRELEAAFALFGDAPTPTEPIDGFLLLAAAALWVSAFVADWAALRLSVSLEALLPFATIFVFASVLADDHQRTTATAVALLAAFAEQLVERVARQARSGRWVTDSSTRGSGALLATGSLILVAAVVAASLSGPSLPGAGSEALVDLEPTNDSPRSRVTVSPLVDIQRRLVDQADVEVFTVRSDQRSYWRLTSLDAFDGRIWSSSGSYGRADGRLDAPIESAPGSVAATQAFEISALAAIWLPAAFEPRRVDSSVDLRYDEASSTLIVDTDIDDSDGVAYTVESALPRFEPGSLAGAGTAYPVDIVETQLGLPADLPQSVRDLAAQVVAPATSPYESARLLQDFLRGFEYSLEVPDGHSGNDLERFLLVDRIGYCEQFSGAFAAMARSLQIPARVAVGFTPGTEVEAGLFSVRGEHAHAWPEVYFPGFGWVPFEPTPGRGAPGAETHTGVPEQQVVSGEPNAATTVVPTTAAPQPATSEPGDEAPQVDTADDETPTTTAPGVGSTGSDEAGDQWWRPWVGRVALASGLLLLTASLYVATALGLAGHRRRHRRRAAVTAPARIGVAWDETLEHLRLLGLSDAPSATHRETVQAALAVLPDGREHTEVVGSLAEAAVFGPATIDDDDVIAATRAADGIATIVRETTSPVDRSKPLLDPKVVLGVGPMRRVGRD